VKVKPKAAPEKKPVEDTTLDSLLGEDAPPEEEAAPPIKKPSSRPTAAKRAAKAKAPVSETRADETLLDDLLKE
jgi:hypothetical protein